MKRTNTALITGASAGIGLAYAELMAHEGYDLVLVARRQERLEKLANKLEREFRIKAHVIPADLCDLSSIDKIVEELTNKNIEIDFLINNAGYSLKRKFSRNTWEDTNDFLQLMMVSLTKLTLLLLPTMKANGYGRIINVSSVAAFVPEDSGSLYTAAKKYVLSFSKALDKEFEGTEINILALCPGFTHTEFHEVLGNKKQVSNFPKFMWMDADTVVREGYEAVMSGKRVHINGWANKVICFLCKILPADFLFSLGGTKKILEDSYKTQ